MQEDELNELLKNDVIVLLETWIIKSDNRVQKLQNLAAAYNIIIEPALVKERGRASGGIIILLRKAVVNLKTIIWQNR